MVILLIILFYRIGIGQIQLFDWDEINFAQISREMILTENFWQPTINFLPFHEKPPLFNWLQVWGYQLFGISEMAARLPNVLAGFISLLSIFYIGSRWRNRRFAWWWVLFMAFSLLPQLYFRSGIIDPWFNLFIFLGLATSAVQKDNGAASKKITGLRIIAGGCLLGLGVLTKGPVALLIAGITLGAYLLLKERANWWSLGWKFALVGFIALLPIMAWVAYIWTLDDGFFAREFLVYQWRLFSQADAGHGGFPGYHIVVLLLGCFPASIFAISRLFSSSAHPVEQLMKILFWTVLILFSIVSTKIVHYSSLAYFPITYLAAAQMDQLYHGGRLLGYQHKLTKVIWGLYSLVLFALPLCIQFVLPQLTFHDLGYRSSNAFSEHRIWLLLLISLPPCWLWFQFSAMYKHKKPIAYGRWLIIGTIYFVSVGLWQYIRPIQSLTQGDYVAFYIDKAEEKPFFGTAYYKSYAPLFYGQIDQINGGQLREYRFHGPIEKPLYFSSPLKRKDQVLREVPDAQWLYDAGGYSFYLRPATQIPPQKSEEKNIE